MTYDLLIIGGGPAGLTAGIYGVRQKLKLLLLSKGFGGQVARKTTAIENFPGFKQISGLDLIQKFSDQFKSLGGEVLLDSAVKVKKAGNSFLVVTKGHKQLQARAIVVASGADPRPLEVPGEKKFIGRGVSYCTTCDAPMFNKKTVAVVGGGNSGFEAAIFLTSYAEKVYLLESGPKVLADPENQAKARKTGKIEVLTQVVLKKIQGDRFLNSIVCQNKKTKKIFNLQVEGVFVEIGSQPATSFVKGLVDFSEKDEIRIDPKTCATKTPGLFAAGDVTDLKYKQIVVAAGEGTKAVLSAAKFLAKS